MDTNSSPNIAEQRYHLTAVCASLRGTELLARPELMALAVEDLTWAIAFEDCSRREPPRWQLAKRRRWCSEVSTLFDERRDLQHIATALGLPV